MSINGYPSTTWESADGRIYQFDARGVCHRISPLKPWANKAERKRYVKARRIQREEAA